MSKHVGEYCISRNICWYFLFVVSRVQTFTRVLRFADSPLIILLYPCISGLRWYFHSRLEDNRVNSADYCTANISTYTVVGKLCIFSILSADRDITNTKIDANLERSILLF